VTEGVIEQRVLPATQEKERKGGKGAFQCQVNVDRLIKFPIGKFRLSQRVGVKRGEGKTNSWLIDEKRW